MQTYIAFLRAINVGGRHVKMDLLRKIFTDAGYANVRTYIQSGNVIFDGNDKDRVVMEKAIASLLENELGYVVPTFIYTPTMLGAIVDSCPFESVPDDMALHVSLLSHTPDERQVQSLLQYENEHEQYRVVGSVVYIMVRQGNYGTSKFSNTFLEKKLNVMATTRNWATINKMAAES